MNYEKSAASYMGNLLMITFSYHRHAVLLGTNGTGFLWNPWNPSKRPLYSLVMPKDIQEMVKILWDTYKAPIPINADLN
jgi:hypothetical protein